MVDDMAKQASARAAKEVRCVGISAILVSCSASKAEHCLPNLRLNLLANEPVSRSATRWLERLASIGRPTSRAEDLYIGRGVKTARAFARTSGCRLFVASAGLGLVDSRMKVPSYDLSAKTIAPSASVDDRKRAVEWWSLIHEGPFSSPIAHLMEGRGRILVAVTRPYAAMVLPALSRLAPEIRGRLRLFGLAEKDVPSELSLQRLRYDSRLDVVSPGVGFDRAVRELTHFGSLIADIPLRSFDDDQMAVSASLANIPHKKLVRRTRVSDATLAENVRRFVAHGESMSCALKKMRSNGLACEEARFRKMFRELTA